MAGVYTLTDSGREGYDSGGVLAGRRQGQGENGGKGEKTGKRREGGRGNDQGKHVRVVKVRRLVSPWQCL